MTRSLYSLLLVTVTALTLNTASAHAQGSLAGTRRSPELLQAFREVVAVPSQSTVRVLGDGKEIALAAVVSADGYLVTKASELRGKLTVKFKDGRSADATIVGIEPKHDLAMLKVQASGLVPVVWVDSKSAEAGDWLATPGLGSEPVAVGVVGVPTRKVTSGYYPRPAPPADSGYLGVFLGQEGPAKIGQLEPSGPARKAGLKVGDIILAVGRRKVADSEQLIETIQRYKANEKVTLKIKRDDEEMDLEITLGKRPSNPGANRGDMQNRMGSALSARRDKFPTILQHDTVVKPSDCGGPIVNLEGKAVGINIARGGRTESYAIPSEVVLALLPDLRSGKLSPRYEETQAKVDALLKELARANAEIGVIERRLKKVASPKDRAERREMRLLQHELADSKKKAEAIRDEIDQHKALLPRK